MNHQIVLAAALGAFVGSCFTAIILAFLVDRYLESLDDKEP